MPDYLPVDELKRLFPGISPDVLARSAAPVARLPDPKRESDQRGKGQNRQPQKSQEGFRYRVTIISLRSRLVDAHDNLRTGAKSLVDIITRSIGFDNDADTRLDWCYHQLIGKSTGTIVLIERL